MIARDRITWKDIETERLLLREVVERDASSIFALYSDAASSVLDDWEPMTHKDEAVRKIHAMREAFAAKEEIPFVLVKKDTRAFVGCCGMFGFDERSSNCCVYYQVARQHRNRGFATEAMRAITQYGIETLHLHRMYAYITPGNDASLKVLTKCGYRKEGCLRDMEFYKGRYWDGIVMAILEQDYFGMG